MNKHRGPNGYAIRVRGRLSDTLLGAFPELRPHSRDGVTALVGELPDQAALHGVLARIEALGLELLEVRRVALRSVDPNGPVLQGLAGAGAPSAASERDPR